MYKQAQLGIEQNYRKRVLKPNTLIWQKQHLDYQIKQVTRLFLPLPEQQQGSRRAVR